LLPTTIITALLAVLLAYAAVRKLSHREEVVRTYLRVGVREEWLNPLAVALLAGSAGLMLGMLWAPVGVVAAAGVACYFVAAIAAHIKAADLANVGTPMLIEALAIAALVLRAGSA